MLRTDRDRAILDALSFRVRVLSLEQIARAWWGDAHDGRRLARRRLAVLERAGLVHRRQVLARPILPLESPEFTWEPGDVAPDSGAISWRLRKRWTEPPRPTAVYHASAETIRSLGGGGGKLPSPGQETHDLHTAEVFLRFRGCSPGLVQLWRGEDVFKADRQGGEKVPDALVVRPDGEPELAVEFAGSYGPERVADFHGYCEAKELAYQLW